MSGKAYVAVVLMNIGRIGNHSLIQITTQLLFLRFLIKMLGLHVFSFYSPVMSLTVFSHLLCFNFSFHAFFCFPISQTEWLTNYAELSRSLLCSVELVAFMPHQFSFNFCKQCNQNTFVFLVQVLNSAISLLN